MKSSFIFLLFYFARISNVHTADYNCSFGSGFGSGTAINVQNPGVTLQDCVNACFEEKKIEPTVNLVSVPANTTENGPVSQCICQKDALGISVNESWKSCEMDRALEPECGSAINGKYLSGGTEILKGNMSFWRCCKTCREELAHAMTFHEEKTYEYEHSCYCYTGAYTFHEWESGASYKEYYHNTFHTASLQVGESNNLITVVNPFKTTNANDKVTVFVIDGTSLETTNRISLHGISDRWLKASLKKDNISLRYTSLEHDLVAQGSYLENYKFEMEIFGQEDYKSFSDIWMVMTRSNDEYYAIVSENFNVTKDDSKNSECFEGELAVLMLSYGKEHVQVSYTADRACNTDISDFQFGIYTEESLEIKYVTEGENCIQISNISTLNRKTVVTYDYYYVDQSICFNINFGIKDDANLVHGTKSSTLVVDAIISVLNNTKTQIKRTKTADVVISKEMLAAKATKHYQGQPDIITIVSDNVTYFCCVAYLNRFTAKCVAFNPTESSIKVMPLQLHQLIGYETSGKILYALDKNGQLVTFDQVKIKSISEARWTKIKSSKRDSLVMAINKQRSELAMKPVNVFGSINATYFGLFDQLSPFILWPTDSACADNVGTTRETAMKSCNDIKTYCPQAKSKDYILAESYGDSNYETSYCVMETSEVEKIGCYKDSSASKVFPEYVTVPEYDQNDHAKVLKDCQDIVMSKPANYMYFGIQARDQCHFGPGNAAELNFKRHGKGGSCDSYVGHNWHNMIYKLHRG